MLATIISNTGSYALSKGSVSTGVCFLSTDFGIPEYYRIAVVGLIILLGIKELLLTSRRLNSLFVDCLDMGIYPLLICFVASFLFAALEVIFAG